MTLIHAHPAVDALEDRIQTNVSLSRRRYPTAILYKVCAVGYQYGIGTTVHGAVKHFLVINKLESE